MQCQHCAMSMDSLVIAVVVFFFFNLYCPSLNDIYFLLLFFCTLCGALEYTRGSRFISISLLLLLSIIPQELKIFLCLTDSDEEVSVLAFFCQSQKWTLQHEFSALLKFSPLFMSSCKMVADQFTAGFV